MISADQPTQMRTVSARDGVLNWILRAVAVAIIGPAAWAKFSDGEGTRLVFKLIGMNTAGAMLIGVLEAACVILLVVPRFTPFGAILTLGLMTGAVIAHATVLGVDGSFGLLCTQAVIAGSASAMLIYRLRHRVSFIAAMFDT